MIFGIDPGDVRIGFTMFSYNAEKRKADLRIREIVDLAKLYQMFTLAEGMLQKDQTHTFVVENFRTDTQVRGVTFQWNEMLTSQCIGAIRYAAYRMNNSRVVLQEPRILAMGRKWCDLPVPKNPNGHIKDDVSAYIHGAHFMMTEGMIDTVDDILKFGQEKM